MRFRSCALFGSLFALALGACPELEKAAAEPPAALAPKPAPKPAPPPHPSPPDAAKVRLRWKVEPGHPIAFELVQRQLSGGAQLRLDAVKLAAGGKAAALPSRPIDLSGPAASTMVAILSRLESGSLAAKLIVTRVEPAPARKKGKKDKRAAKVEAQLAKALESMQGTVQVRGVMNDAGFVTSDMKREQRNLLVLCFELPNNDVAVGDTWKLSADLVRMDTGFVADDEQRSNEATLTALEKDAAGRPVAIIDFVVAETEKGRFTESGLKAPLEAAMAMAYKGHGEFLVDEGRWKQLVLLSATTSSGPVKADTQSQLVVRPLEPVPPKLLKLE